MFITCFYLILHAHVHTFAIVIAYLAYLKGFDYLCSIIFLVLFMAKYTIYVEMPDYLKQWIMHEFYDEESKQVRFPRGSAAACILAAAVCKAPAEAALPPSGCVPVAVPVVKGLNPSVYNHVSAKGKIALVSTCRKMFQALLYKELHGLFVFDVPIVDVIAVFCEKHGISDDPKNWEAVRQIYARLRRRSTSCSQSDDDVNES